MLSLFNVSFFFANLWIDKNKDYYIFHKLVNSYNFVIEKVFTCQEASLECDDAISHMSVAWNRNDLVNSNSWI